MRTSFYSSILLAVFFLISGCSITEQVQQTESTERQNSSAADVERPIPYPIDIPGTYKRALDKGTRSADGTPGENYWINEARYILSAELRPDDHSLYGQASVTYTNHSPDDLGVIVLELAQNLHKEGTPKKEITEITGGMNLTKIEVNGLPAEETNQFARWTQNSKGYIIDGTRLYIFPDEIVESGSSVELDFEWTFKIPEQGASGRMGRSRGNLYFLAYWYPQVAVYDDVYGWLDDPFVGNAEFYHDFADYEVTVTAPKEWLVMGTGEFLNPEETLSEQTLERYLRAGNSDEIITVADFDELDIATLETDEEVLTWKFRAEKVRDVAFSATLESRWDAARTPVGDLNGDGQTNYSRINTFFRESAPLWQEQADYAQHAIAFLSEYTHFPYPWPHMTSVEGADIIGGGMEFPMMTIIGAYNNAGPRPLYGVTAHELAHMWFPMILSSNERRYTWIDEGYTTFHTNEANKDRYGDAFDNNSVFGGYLQIAGTDFEGEMMRWSDFHYPGPAYGVASYPKPASALIALRGLVGEEAFLEAHHELIERWNYKHLYPWDIFNTIEDVTGEDLGWFWRSWYYETWVLDQRVTNVSASNGETIITIEDIGNIPMPVYLEVTFEDGSTRMETIDVGHWLEGHRTKELGLTTRSPVVKVEIDPELLFPDVNRNNNVWRP